MSIFRKRNFSQNFIKFCIKEIAQGCKPDNIQILDTELPLK